MSDTREKWEEDVEWLYARAATINKRPTEAQEEAFCEKTAVIVADGVNEKDARMKAFKELYK